MTLDISHLENALTRLHESLNYVASPLAQADEGVARQFKMATIQAFEFTYELTHKILKRYLEATEPNPQTVDEMSFPTLIRTAAERGLLKNSWDHWINYRKARGITSHTYHQTLADEVFALIPAFAQEVAFILETIHNRQKAQGS